MRNFFKYYLFTLLIIISSLFNLGNSSFVVGGGHSATKGDIKVNDGGRAVCYNGTTKDKYTSIEGAFAEVFITDFSILKDCFDLANDIIDNSDLASYQSNGKLYRYTYGIQIHATLLRSENYFTVIKPNIKVEELK